MGKARKLGMKFSWKHREQHAGSKLSHLCFAEKISSCGRSWLP